MLKRLRGFLCDLFDRAAPPRRPSDELPSWSAPRIMPISNDHRERMAAAKHVELRRELAARFFVAGLAYEGHSMKHEALARRAVRDADCLLNELEMPK